MPPSSPSGSQVGISSPDFAARMAPALQALDADRRVYFKKAQSGALWGTGVLVVGALVVALAHWPMIALVFPLIAALVTGIWIAVAANQAYAGEFKALIMPTLVREFGDLNYLPTDGLTQSDFEMTRLFSRPDRFNSHDLVEGMIGATRIRFCEVLAEEEHESTDSDGDRHTEYRDIFRGLFYIVDFNKNFQGQTFILPEGGGASFGRLGAAMQNLEAKAGRRGELVKLEDPEFERLFVVDSTDQTEARYILSTSLMRRFVELKQLHNSKVHAAFIAGHVYVFIDKRGSQFAPPPISKPLEIASLGPIVERLRLAVGLVSDLDLNTRIWSKE